MRKPTRDFPVARARRLATGHLQTQTMNNSNAQSEQRFLARLCKLPFARLFVGETIVYESEVGVLEHEGRLVETFEPGIVRYFKRNRRVHRVEMCEQELCLPAQDLLLAGGVSIKLSAIVFWRVSDVMRALRTRSVYQSSLYIDAQLALRDCASRINLDELMQSRKPLELAFLDRLEEDTTPYGLDVSKVLIKDIILGGDLKRAYLEQTKARAEAKAQLERTRGETAVLRNLKNAARLLEESDGLYRLRLLETAKQAAENASNSLVLEMPREADGLGIRND